jgi:transcriptional regulator with XRE-family HTH domain
MTLGEKIKQLRKAADFSMRELAIKSGLSPEYISRLESGDIESPGLETLRSISKTLGIDLNEVVQLSNIAAPHS